jgi:hypothetical protein
MHLDLLAASLIGDMLGIEGELGTAAGRQRNNFKMNVLESSIDKFPRIQQGIGLHVKNLQANLDWLRRLLRVKAKAARFSTRTKRLWKIGASLEKRIDERA